MWQCPSPRDTSSTSQRSTSRGTASGSSSTSLPSTSPPTRSSTSTSSRREATRNDLLPYLNPPSYLIQPHPIPHAQAPRTHSTQGQNIIDRLQFGESLTSTVMKVEGRFKSFDGAVAVAVGLVGLGPLEDVLDVAAYISDGPFAVVNLDEG